MENSGKPRILIFSTSYFPLVGGAEIAIKELTDRLPEYCFEMITSNEAGVLKEEAVGNILVHRVGPRGNMGKLLLPFLGTIKTFSILRKRKIDLFWGMMVTFASGIPYIVNFKRKVFGYKKIPIILTLQEGDSEDHIKKRWFGLIGWSWKLALSRTDYLTVISNYLDKMSRRYGYKGGVSLIPNGVDVDNFKSQKRDREGVVLESLGTETLKLKKDLGFNKNDFVFVHVGRLTKKNGVEDIITSLLHLPLNFKFLQIGIGELEDEIKKQSHDVGVDERVVFAGLVPHSDLAKYLAIGDVFVRPSLSEGLGNVFLEAMTFGLPVVGTKVGGIPDFLVDGETGLFCNVQDPKSIAEKVKLLVEDKQLGEKLIRNGQELVKEKYNWNFIAPKMSSVFKKFLN